MSYSEAETLRELQTGDIVDIFTLETMIHDGPMARLFLARDLLSREKVILKVPNADIINHPVILYHYQNEDRISRKLNHPGIITYIHRQKSREYIIMAYAGGRDLRSRIGKEKSLSLNESLRIMEMLCGVIRYLHEKGIVHLDLKPENILCLENGSIKLLDFGLASCRDLPDLLSDDLESPQGTPWYVSPEQLLGERHHPGCDIYSLGMIFYEMVTGYLPWPRSSKLRIARRRLSQDPAPPRYYNPEVPPQIQSIIMKAIERRLDRRYSTAARMEDDIRTWQDRVVSDADRADRKPTLWKRIWPGKPIQLKNLKTRTSEWTPVQGQMIGAVLTLDELDDVVAEVKRQAMKNSFEVTLVHVIEEENDSELMRYSLEVEGERLKSHLEQAVQLLRRLNIDPTIRLVKGDAAHSLIKLCSRLNARLLILGKSWSKKKLFQGESGLDRLTKKCSCPVKTADEGQLDPIEELLKNPIRRLTSQQVLAIDIYLTDLWYNHLHFHTDFIYRLLLGTAQDIDLDEHNCQFGQFLDMIRQNEDWGNFFSILDPIHREFHDASRSMSGISKDNHKKLHQLYTRLSLPLSCNLKGELSRISHLLREQVEAPPPVLPFLADTSCPVTLPGKSCYGPILKAITLDRHLSVLSGSTEEETGCA